MDSGTGQNGRNYSTSNTGSGGDSDQEPSRRRRKPVNQRDQPRSTDEKNYNELMRAIVEKRELSAIFIIRKGIDLDQKGHDGKRAIDLAFDNEMYEVAMELLEADSPFPQDPNFEVPEIIFERFNELIDFRLSHSR